MEIDRRYLQPYFDNLENSYDRMKVLGMSNSISLRKIFVRVNILEKITERKLEDLDKLQEQFEYEKRSFGIKKKTTNGLEVVDSYQRLIVLGKPGAGKTTFLKRIMLWALDEELSKVRIPVFISLKDFSESGKSLHIYILEYLLKKEMPDRNATFPEFLEEGLFLFLFDGLDEVKSEYQEYSIKQLIDFTDQHHENQFIITCRIAAYNSTFESYTDVEMADFSDKQILRFIKNWFADEVYLADQCWKNLEITPQIKELAKTPILLTLLCITYEQLLYFPTNRSELYRESVETLLKEWDSSRRIYRGEIFAGLSINRKIQLLSRIAFNTFTKREFFLKGFRLERQIAEYISNLPLVNEESLDIDSKAVLKAIIAHHGLIVPRAKNIYSFSHLTIHEYFTAKYLVENSHLMDQIIDKYIIDDQWREVFLLTATMLEEADKFFSGIINWIINFVKSSNLVPILDKIPQAIKPNNIFESRDLRVIAIIYILDRAFARGLDIDKGLIPARNNADEITKTLNINFPTMGGPILGETRSQIYNQVLDLEEIVNLAQEFDQNLHLCQRFFLYIKVNRLLIECLQSECYVSKDYRQKILQEFLFIHS